MQTCAKLIATTLQGKNVCLRYLVNFGNGFPRENVWCISVMYN